MKTILPLPPKDADLIIKQNTDNNDFVILDIRTKSEFLEARIKNAINIDFYSDDFKNNLEELDKDKTYMVYCAAGVRSGKSCKIMTDIGFNKIYDIKGGIKSWQLSGLETIN